MKASADDSIEMANELMSALYGEKWNEKLSCNLHSGDEEFTFYTETGEKWDLKNWIFVAEQAFLYLIQVGTTC